MQRAPQLRGDGRRQHGGMGVHAALGMAGGARGIGQHAQLMRQRQLRRRRQVQGDCIFQRGQSRVAQGLARGTHHLGHILVLRLRCQPVAVGMDHHGLQPAGQGRRHAGQHLRQQLLRHQGDAGAAVLDVILHLGRGAHGIDRHHGGAGTQHRIVGRHELRAVLADQQHPIAALHPQALAQKAGQRIDPGLKLRIGEHRAAIDDGGLVRVALGRHVQVMGQRHLRHTNFVRQALGPEAVMGGGHAVCLHVFFKCHQCVNARFNGPWTGR